MSTAQATVALTQEQIDFYHQEGYLALPALTSVAEVTALQAIYDRIFREQAGREEGNQFDLAGVDEDGQPAFLPQILNPGKYAPELLQTQLLINARHVTRQLLGPAATCGIGHAIYKPPKIGAATPWHQDAAYWSPDYDYQSLSIWVPLQEAKIENGCMWFVPRSHLAGDIYEHQSINNDPRIHGLEFTAEALPRVRGELACPLPPGGATIHGGYMFHHTGPNRSDIPRRALILMGGLPGSKRAQPRDLHWMRAKTSARNERAKQAAAKAAAEKAAQEQQAAKK